jgi:hypothetical protein
MNANAIIFDIDWAPDFMVRLCMDICRRYGTAATFFATHPSDTLLEIESDPLFELGIHPNFMSGSSHGNTLEEVMDYCQRLVPNARSMRTHGLYQHTRLFQLILSSYPKIKTDVSFFLPAHANLAPVEWCFGDKNRKLVRLANFWDDYYSAGLPEYNWQMEEAPSNGIRIFSFHPVHVAMNTETLAGYEAVRRRGHIADMAPDGVEAISNKSNRGSRSFLQRLVANRRNYPFYKVSELS